MSTVAEHYAEHLAPVYVWMAGGVEPAVARGDAEIALICSGAQRGLAAVDLGAGFGMHAIPLARRGYKVTAIDSSAILLDTLRDCAGDLPITVVEDDFLNAPEHVEAAVDLVLCMGDTLTHLPDIPSLERLFDSAQWMLRRGGRLVLTFRDYSRALAAERRFIPVRSDETRILTCFLEYSNDHVAVHDVLYELRDSAWQLSVSAYRKLRLAPDFVAEALQSHGFDVHAEPGPSGMVRLIATRA